jgi:hypothetical protein
MVLMVLSSFNFKKQFTMKIVSGILILISVYLNVKHGWSGLSGKMSVEEGKMFTDLGINGPAGKIIGALLIVIAALLLLPQTFFIGNLMNAALILLIMALALKTGNSKTALIEIPFLIMPLVMIWLGHPLRK